METLTRSQLAGAANVNIETLRYYERRGLLPAPPRSAANYRRYPKSAARLVRFVKHAQDLGFSLDEIQELLSLRLTRGATSGEVRKRAQNKIVEVTDRIRSLERIRGALEHLVSRCSGEGPIEECPILHAFEHGRERGQHETLPFSHRSRSE